MTTTINADNGVSSGSAGLKSSADSSGVLALQTNGTTAISIDTSQAVSFTNAPTVTGGTANGVAYLNGSKVLTTGSALVFDGTNLGVGTTSPAYPLDVVGASSGGWTLNMRGRSADNIGYMRFSSNNGATTYAAIGTPAANTLAIEVNGSERARITSSGSLLVGTSTQTSNGVSSPLIQSNGSFYSSGSTGAGYFFENRSSSTGWYGWYATSGTIYLYNGTSGVANNIASINTTTGVYTAVSDVNKKKDFESSNLGLAAVMQLKPTLYRMLDADENSAKELGFIAQDVKDVIPQAYVEVDNNETCASGSASKFIGLNDRAIVATLTKAIQEQQALITQLQADVAALKGA
jgi:hypothetical protein